MSVAACDVKFDSAMWQSSVAAAAAAAAAEFLADMHIFGAFWMCHLSAAILKL